MSIYSLKIQMNCASAVEYLEKAAKTIFEAVSKVTAVAISFFASCFNWTAYQFSSYWKQKDAEPVPPLLSQSAPLEMSSKGEPATVAEAHPPEPHSASSSSTEPEFPFVTVASPIPQERRSSWWPFYSLS